jgi:hypothetical protein
MASPGADGEPAFVEPGSLAGERGPGALVHQAEEGGRRSRGHAQLAAAFDVHRVVEGRVAVAAQDDLAAAVDEGVKA